MLRLARLWMVVALVSAFFVFTGILEVTAGIALVVFYLSAAFCVFSLLLCLFEGEGEPVVTAVHPKGEADRTA